MLSTSTWCVDTGASNHICNSLQEFHQTRQLSDGEIYIFLGDGTRVSAVAVGDVSISFGRNSILVLKDSLYIPSIRRNLISVSRLVDNGYSVYFSNSVVIKLNKRFICSGTLVDGLYVVNYISPAL